LNTWKIYTIIFIAMLFIIKNVELLIYARTCYNSTYNCQQQFNKMEKVNKQSTTYNYWNVLDFHKHVTIDLCTHMSQHINLVM